jgi:RNA polymerase sigma-70 factor, ECF subfamily
MLYAALACWDLLLASRADPLRKLGRVADASDAYRAALALGPPPAEHTLLSARLDELRPGDGVG